MAVTIKKKSNQNSDQLQVFFNRATTRFVKDLRSSRYRPGKISYFKKKKAALIRERHRRENAKRKFYE